MIEITDEDIVFLAEPHEYKIRGQTIRSVTQTIDDAGLGDDFFMVPPDVLRMAQSRGNAVHAACSFMDAGELDISSVDERVWGYVRAYANFRNMIKIQTIHTEESMAAEIAEGMWLAGTPDWICFLNGQRCVIDLKTGQNKSAGLQTMGYRILYETLHRNEPIRERYSLRLRVDGTFKLLPEEDPDDEMAFWDLFRYSKAKERMDRWTKKYC